MHGRDIANIAALKISRYRRKRRNVRCCVTLRPESRTTAGLVSAFMLISISTRIVWNEFLHTLRHMRASAVRTTVQDFTMFGKVLSFIAKEPSLISTNAALSRQHPDCLPREKTCFAGGVRIWHAQSSFPFRNFRNSKCVTHPILTAQLFCKSTAINRSKLVQLIWKLQLAFPGRR